MRSDVKTLEAHRIYLDESDMKKLKEAASLLTKIFSDLTGHDNITHIHNVLGRLEDLIEEIEADGNQIVEFKEV